MPARHSKQQEDKLKKQMTEAVPEEPARIKTVATRNYVNMEELWVRTGKPQVLFAMTGRGTGKTTSMACWMADYCYKNNRQFILISRDAFKQVKRQAWFHNAVVRGLTPYDVRCERNQFMINNQIIGFNYSLHAYSDYRSIEFPAVDFIIFEEFIELEPSNYWSDNGISEAQFLSDLISTVFRDRTDGACILLGNNLNEDSKYNPYFDAFGIDFDEMDIQIGNSYDIRNDGRLHTVLYYGGMGRFSDDDVQGWAAWMPLNDVALTGEFHPNPLLLTNFLHDNGINIERLQLDGSGLALCTQGIVEYITYYTLGDEEYHIVSRQAVGNVDYEPYRFRYKASVQRFQLNHGTKMLYETAKDYATIRKALDVDQIGIRETQRNAANFTRLMNSEKGRDDAAIAIRTMTDLERWSWSMIRKCKDREDYEELIRAELSSDINPDWIDTVYNRQKDLLDT